ncbi:hypothetical protein BC834DRAFT_971832 [Gloeopeniophorella convolvens]|nr:hypothetical protein BC834DRAFT_971832 [Gloeopeniophorella convolvens]
MRMPQLLPQDGVEALCWAIAIAMVLECLARAMRNILQVVGAPKLDTEWHGRLQLGWTAQSPGNAAPRASRGVGTASDTVAAGTGETQRAPAQEDAPTQADVRARALTPAQDGALVLAPASTQENAPAQLPEGERAQARGGGWARVRARVVTPVQAWMQERLRQHGGGRMDIADLDSEEYYPRRQGGWGL